MKTKTLQAMPTARLDYAAATMNGKIYVAGGYNENSVIYLDTLYIIGHLDIWTFGP